MGRKSDGSKQDFINGRTRESYKDLFNIELRAGKKPTAFLKRLLKMNVWRIILSCFIYVLQSAPVFLVPLCTADIIDTITVAISSGVYAGVYRRLIINAVIMAVSIVMNVPTTIWRYGIISKVIRKTSANVKDMLVRKLQMLSISYHKNIQKGRVQSKFIKDTEGIDSFMSNLLHTLLPNVVSVVMATVISLYRNVYISLFFVVVIPLNIWLVGIFRKKLRKNYHDYRVKAESMSAKLTNMMTMIPVTKSHGLEKVEIVNMEHSIEDLAGSGIKLDKNTANFGSWVFVVNMLLKAVCLVFCAYLAIKGVITVGEVVLFESIFAQITSMVSIIINSAPILSSGMESVRSVAEIMNATDIEQVNGKIQPCKINGEITFQNLSYKYPEATDYAVKNLNLQVKAGECVAFVGASGSGKSTVMNLIIGFMQASSGKILIDGKDIAEYDLSQYRKHISVVPQSSILFPGTIKDNITYGLEKYTQSELDRVLEMANVNEFISTFPKGVETDVGELGEKLSGGQKQRITIARALIRNPQILILDEATSALDNISELHVQKAIASSIMGRTTFIVAHRLSTIRDADKIVVLENGECVECGSYAELMAKKGKFYQLKQLSDIENKKAETELS